MGLKRWNVTYDWLYECGAGFVTTMNRPGIEAVQRVGAGLQTAYAALSGCLGKGWEA